MTIHDILYIFCKDDAANLLSDISLIDKDISTIPSTEYIQTFIDKLTTNAHLDYYLNHFTISTVPLPNSNPMHENDLSLGVKSGYWIYRTNSNDGRFRVTHEFLYLGATSQAYMVAKKLIEKYKQDELYTWLGIINTLSGKVTMWTCHNKNIWRKRG